MPPAMKGSFIHLCRWFTHTILAIYLLRPTLSHAILLRATLSLTTLPHTAFSHNLSSGMPFLFPASPISCPHLSGAFWKKLTCGVCRSCIFDPRAHVFAFLRYLSLPAFFHVHLQSCMLTSVQPYAPNACSHFRATFCLAIGTAAAGFPIFLQEFLCLPQGLLGCGMPGPGGLKQARAESQQQNWTARWPIDTSGLQETSLLPANVPITGLRICVGSGRFR